MRIAVADTDNAAACGIAVMAKASIPGRRGSYARDRD
jgi:hypothetical protein